MLSNILVSDNVEGEMLGETDNLCPSLQNVDVDRTLNHTLFCKASSYAKWVAETHNIAPSRQRIEQEIDEVLDSAEWRFHATCANQIGELLLLLESRLTIVRMEHRNQMRCRSET